MISRTNPQKDTPTKLNPLSVMLWLFGCSIPITLTIAMIVSLRSGVSTTQSQESIRRLLTPPSKVIQ